MTFIVAGTYDQAWYWAQEWKIRKQAWRFVYSTDQLHGVSDAEVRFAGSYLERPDIREVFGYVLWLESHGRVTIWNKTDEVKWCAR